MNEKEIQKNEDIEINLGRIVRAIAAKAWLVTIVAVLCAVLTFVGTFFLITPRYTSSAMFYVNNNAFPGGDASHSISSGDLTTSRNLVDSYIVILYTRETLNDVIDYVGANLTYSELREMISSQAVNETEIFEVAVTSTNAQDAERLANAIAYILPKRISTILEGTSAKVVDEAVVPSRPSSPSYSANTVIGFLLGAMVTIGIIAVREIFDVTIRSEEDVTQCCNHPILTLVPDMTVSGKGSPYYYRSYGRSNKKKVAYEAASRDLEERTDIMGPNIGFAASEAYKLLRTKIQFSFADDNACHVIGLSSALSGEGKSLTAVNLAYTLSELNKKVLLIDCDMRLPTLAKKLQVRKNPGLSSFLTGQSLLTEVIQCCNFREREKVFHVIAAGQTPPNPVELLSSARMKQVLEKLRSVYDYVILDLPPVGEVTDAMAVSNETDGILLVVRQNYCDRVALADAARQFQFIRAKIIGTVFNCTSEHSGSYSKGYYKRYYRRYYSRYRKSNYETNDRSAAQPEDKHSKV